MKKLLAGIATVGVLGIGGVLVAGKEEPVNTDGASADVETPVEEQKEEVVAIPTSRTVDIPHDGMPWEYYDNKKVELMQKDGDIVYLFSDAALLEQRILEVAGVDPNAEGFKKMPNNYTKEKMNATTAESVRLFIDGVSSHVPNKKGYFDKLEEARQAMLNKEYDTVPTIIADAKILRESK